MNILLVDDEEHILKGVSRIISCEEDDWDVETALSGEVALECLANDHFDVIVSDMRMPGMDGAQLLDEVVKRQPSILRIVLSGQADRETVLRAVNPMHQYLSKPCEPEKLIAVIKRAEALQETIKSAKVLEAIGQANCLPSIPDVVDEINAELESGNSTSDSIGEIVCRDPALSARVLQLCNSTLFGLRQPCTEIGRAVSLVGVDVVRSLALTQVVFSTNENVERILPAKSILDHGYEVASLAKRLAKHSGEPSEEGNTAFTAGLLHDVGKLILLNAFPERYQKVVESAKTDSRSVDELEMEEFDAAHQGVGAYLFVLWGLPANVTDAVVSHHSFSICSRSENVASRLVFAANWITRNKTADDLNALLESNDSTEEGQIFVNQITEWQQFIDTNKAEG